MLALESLSVRRGHTEVLRSIDLHVEKGEIVALVGANGAGKTTLLMTISGLLRPHEGRLVFDAGHRARWTSPGAGGGHRGAGHRALP